MEGIFIRIAHHVRPVRQIANVGDRVDHTEWKSGLRRYDTGQLPAAKSYRSCLTEGVRGREIHSKADDEPLADVEERVALFKSQRTLDRLVVANDYRQHGALFAADV